MLTIFVILFLYACVQDWWLRKKKPKPPQKGGTYGTYP